VHGWRDEIVPVENSIRYAGEYHGTLQVIDSDHRMLQNLPQILGYFALFLRGLK